MPKGDGTRKLSPEACQEIIRIYTTPNEDGTWTGAKTIAKQFDVSPPAIRHLLIRMRVPMRSAKEAHAGGKRCKPITNVPPPSQPPPFCKCGCGESVVWNRRKNRWNAYVSGHYRKHGVYKDRTWLRENYFDNRRSAFDIADELGVSTASIYKAVRTFGLERMEYRPDGMRRRVIGPKPWKDRTGENNPAWKGGVTPERQRLYKTPQWRTLITSIFARDNYHCQRCGAPQGHPHTLQTHHIRPWADDKSLRFDPANLITLCRTCHLWVHSRANVDCEFLR